jgi:hypothetical protein
MEGVRMKESKTMQPNRLNRSDGRFGEFKEALEAGKRLIPGPAPSVLSPSFFDEKEFQHDKR